MAKKVEWMGLVVVGILVLSGCSMLNKNAALSDQGLRNKSLVTDTQLKGKDDEVDSLKETSVKSLEDVVVNVSNVGEISQQIDKKLIQTALKNAGFYQGAVDGIMGKMTRKAVRDFQEANSLSVDGKVGKNTWLVLKGYLEEED